MDLHRQNSTASSSKGRMTTVAAAITSAIDTDAVANSIFTSLMQDSRSTNSPSTANSSAREEEKLHSLIETLTTQNALLAELLRDAAAERQVRWTVAFDENVEVKIQRAVAAAMAEREQRSLLGANARLLREQTLCALLASLNLR